MGGVLHLFGENIRWVDGTGNMADESGVVEVRFANFVLAKIDIFDAFVGEGGRPVDGGLIVVVDGSRRVGICHIEVGGTMAEAEDVFDTLVCGKDLSLARALGGLVLADGPPSDGAATAANQIARERSELEEFDGGAIRHRVSDLTAPARVSKCSEEMAFGWRGGSSVGVCLFVVVVRKMIEGSEGSVAVRMEGDAIGTGAVEIFEAMDGSLVMLVGGIIAVGRQKGEDWGNIRAGAGSQPIDGTDDALVYFGAAFEVGVIR